MSSKSEWTAVHERLMHDQRQRLGPPPTAEEIEAYENGTLSPQDEERVRALLVCYPELARMLVRQEEADAPRPGDADYLSKSELENDWHALQRRMRTADGGGRVLQFWRITAAIAATLAVVFGGLLWRARSELGQPRIAYEYVLEDDAVRGGADSGPPVKPDGEHVLLTIIPVGRHEHYRVDIMNASSLRWSGRAMQRPGGKVLSVVVPSRFLQPGSYSVVLYGSGDGREEKLATYPFRVER